MECKKKRSSRMERKWKVRVERIFFFQLSGEIELVESEEEEEQLERKVDIGKEEKEWMKNAVKTGRNDDGIKKNVWKESGWNLKSKRMIAREGVKEISYELEWKV